MLEVPWFTFPQAHVIINNMQESTDWGSQDFDAHRALVSVGSFGLVGGGILAVHLALGWGIGCSFLALTGWKCPFCGSTRAAAALIRGDLVSAWGFNQVFMLGVGLLGLATVAWMVEVAGGPALRPPRIIRPLTQEKVYLVGAVLAIAFTVLRNIWW